LLVVSSSSSPVMRSFTFCQARSSAFWSSASAACGAGASGAKAAVCPPPLVKLVGALVEVGWLVEASAAACAGSGASSAAAAVTAAAAARVRRRRRHASGEVLVVLVMGCLQSAEGAEAPHPR